MSGSPTGPSGVITYVDDNMRLVKEFTFRPGTFRPGPATSVKVTVVDYSHVPRDDHTGVWVQGNPGGDGSRVFLRHDGTLGRVPSDRFVDWQPVLRRNENGG